MPRRQPTPESCVLKGVTDLLTVERIWWMRMNTRVVDVVGRNGKTRPMFFGRKGCADIVSTPRCRRSQLAPLILWIECKAPGEVQREEQEHFQAEVEAAGHHYIVAHSSDDVLRWLEKHAN
jgi:hypothetical protein